MRLKVVYGFLMFITFYCIILWAFIRIEAKEIYIPMIIFGVIVLLLLTVLPLILMRIEKNKNSKNKEK